MTAAQLYVPACPGCGRPADGGATLWTPAGHPVPLCGHCNQAATYEQSIRQANTTAPTPLLDKVNSWAREVWE